MWYRLLADLVVVLHVAYVAYIVVGFALILAGLVRGWAWARNPWLRLSHLAAILIVVLELIFKTTCPLTVLEFKLRSLAGQPVTEATFVERMMYHALSGWLPGSVTIWIYVVVALVITVTFVLAPPRRRRVR
ncbi:MAG TPA: DUF2784 domain-containing protein [Pyrinomonadaceae bacterium]|nr:DUF2784 domain-containing protein [Pyrinomonadaceae bacterium]